VSKLALLLKHYPFSNENYYPLSSKGCYTEVETGKKFFFKHIVGLPYPVKHYYFDPNLEDPNHPDQPGFTTEERKLIHTGRTQVLDKYHKPDTFLEPSTPKAQTLKALIEQKPGRKLLISDVWWRHYEERLKYIGALDDNRLLPAPIEPLANKADPEEGKPKTRAFIRNLARYIKHRFEDWVDSFGNRRKEEGKGPPFWIDLWDPEALYFGEQPEADNHPRIRIEKDWEERQRAWTLANKRTLALSKLGRLGVGRAKLIWTTNKIKEAKRKGTWAPEHPEKKQKT
jgi:hypothetical protein